MLIPLHAGLTRVLKEYMVEMVISVGLHNFNILIMMSRDKNLIWVIIDKNLIWIFFLQLKPSICCLFWCQVCLVSLVWFIVSQDSPVLVGHVRNILVRPVSVKMMINDDDDCYDDKLGILAIIMIIFCQHP